MRVPHVEIVAKVNGKKQKRNQMKSKKSSVSPEVCERAELIAALI